MRSPQLLMGLSVLVALFAASDSFAQITQYPPRMYGDTAHAPFYHGVASGDPLPNAVLLWTRVTPDSATAPPIALVWQVATDTAFANVVANGIAMAISAKDFTVTVDATGLQPNTVYYYRFQEPNGDYSLRGRTKTAPTGTVDILKMAVISCSSIFSGYFNAYARLGERTDVDVIVHLGDYIYDFVDEDEEVRVPVPYPTVPQTVDQWRDRHEYYLLDPDLRYARAQHPWIVMWDNHDARVSNPAPGEQAFLEWVPIRVPDATRPDIIYRNFVFGDLFSLHMLDIQHFRDVDIWPSGDTSLLGTAQYGWFVDAWQSSSAKWQLIGSQKMVGGWYSHGVPQSIFPHNGTVFDTNSWDGYFGERAKLFALFDSLNRRNNLFISGDAHISMAMDLAIDPFDSIQYNKLTGAGGVGVEFLPTSISRGNFDEQGVDPNLVGAAVAISKSINPHHIYMEVEQHGYGLLHIRKDSVTAEFWYSPILQQTSTETLGQQLVVKDGDGHWKRNIISSVQPAFSGTREVMSLIRPNPAKDWIEFDVWSANPVGAQIKIFNIAGKQVKVDDIRNSAGGDTYRIYTGHLAPALYIIQVTTAEGSMIRQFVKN